MANPRFVTGEHDWLNEVSAGVGGESGGFRGFLVGFGDKSRIFRDRVADLATGAAIIS